MDKNKEIDHLIAAIKIEMENIISGLEELKDHDEDPCDIAPENFAKIMEEKDEIDLGKIAKDRRIVTACRITLEKAKVDMFFGPSCILDDFSCSEYPFGNNCLGELSDDEFITTLERIVELAED